MIDLIRDITIIFGLIIASITIYNFIEKIYDRLSKHKNTLIEIKGEYTRYDNQYRIITTNKQNQSISIIACKNKKDYEKKFAKLISNNIQSVINIKQKVS